MGENILVDPPPLNKIKGRHEQTVALDCILIGSRTREGRVDSYTGPKGFCGRQNLQSSKERGPDCMFPWCPSLALSSVWGEIVKTDFEKYPPMSFSVGVHCPYSQVLCS